MFYLFRFKLFLLTGFVNYFKWKKILIDLFLCWNLLNVSKNKFDGSRNALDILETFIFFTKINYFPLNTGQITILTQLPVIAFRVNSQKVRDPVHKTYISFVFSLYVFSYNQLGIGVVHRADPAWSPGGK